MTEKCSFSFKNCSCELKVAYILILILFVLFLSLCCMRCKKANKAGNSIADKEIFAWIQKNPKAILDSVEVYVKEEQIKAQQQQQEESKKGVEENYNEIISEVNTGIANPKGKKVIVEFFDYNCGYCKMASKAVKEIADENKGVKIIFREMPILGQPSVVAAQYSVAVSMVAPEKFLEFHDALIHGNARTEDGIRQALNKAKVPVAKVEKALKDKKADIEKRINDNRDLAQKLGLGGTPAFVINKQFVPGYIEKAQILELLK